ncbi:amidohydrolase family protein [Pseudosulfitobacter pseudonitzschiae]|uniref:amidohydrolase family protein n=1 Tax=Pseudosulfitobacter pseudonitzschiae TaxID=1402135 RepID=UPI001AF5F25D|nr:amidohydrolase family protein [Pseudosulfitobacter pseudonitzschiae]MBM1815052.1 amidohydrolase family protein [Pseudosulfitobacter pseudonitzschiae]MBM1832043.1 amidohydrolase family protein [Pseudosulfitobacter pseudonitzschiae]MBM1836911.1 amidohydrolase family protein [Pseudosulfitobacter pseudonitzschiae]MBM1841757.1 amidohydrolase family protein [Pseudosulfitobacter pseudonitzschiae]MBM1846625.1 amidohydrolase family protein [Pseudosulfitobacter pseudonitzschiae]
MPDRLLLKNLRLMGADPVDVLIEGGRISQIAAAIAPRTDDTVEQCAGAIALPGLVDAHAHLDKTLWGMPWHPHAQGKSLQQMIDTERSLRHELDMDAARQSARQVTLALSKGTTAIRSHVDIDTDHGLKMFEGVAETRARFADVMQIEIVAFPQSGMMIRPGTVELMDQALRDGADIVGGLDPSGIDRDPKGQLDAIFGLAEKHGKPVDIHLHEAGELGAFSLDMILDRTQALAMQGKVTVSHAFCLGMNDTSRVNAQLDRIAALGVSLATTAPASRPVPSVAACRERGIAICAGNDGIRDTWTPYGNACMLERAMLVGLRNNFRADTEVAWALDTCTTYGARVMELDGYGLEVGCRADLVLVEVPALSEAVTQRPARRLVISGGQIVARDGETLGPWQSA